MTQRSPTRKNQCRRSDILGWRLIPHKHRDGSCQKRGDKNPYNNSLQYPQLLAGSAHITLLFSGAPTGASGGGRRPERTTTTGYVLLTLSPELNAFAASISCFFSSTIHRIYCRNMPTANDPETSTMITIPKNSCGEPEWSG